MTANQKSRTVARLGLLFALACAFSFIESLIPTSFFLPPGVKLGLSNLVTMFSAVFLGIPSAVMITVLKSGFVLLTRGAVAGLMSVGGGVFSLLVMAFFIQNKKARFTLRFISICGAVGHNIGQLIISSLLLASLTTFAYAPVLLLSGIFMGYLTSVLFFALLPPLKNITVFSDLKSR